MSQWFKSPIKSRIAFYLPSNIKGEEMSKKKRKKLIRATMAFLVKKLGGGTQIEAVGSFESDNKKQIVQEDVTICYSFLTPEAMKEHDREINQIANGLCIAFEQQSLAVEKNNWFYLFEPSPIYIRNYKRYMKTAKQLGTEWGYEKWLRISYER
jgi:hypothetical protein